MNRSHVKTGPAIVDSGRIPGQRTSSRPVSFDPTVVSVVIPTVGRDSVLAAVGSARTQHGARSEIIVVCDCPAVPPAVAELTDSIDRIVCTGGGIGAAGARNLGVAAAGGEYVAFLDDDDEWLPAKLQLQVQQARSIEATGRVPVVSSRILQRKAGSDPCGAAGPRHILTADQRPEDYLFANRLVGFGRPMLPTSTLLTTRQFALSHQWDADLRRHTDWDWLVRASAVPEVSVRQLAEPLVVYTIGSTGSMSASPDWRSSFEWATRHRSVWADSTLADFLASQTLRYALQGHDWSGAREIVAMIRECGGPSLRAGVSGLTGMIPRRLAEKILLAARGRKAAGTRAPVKSV
jgi:glycosyltransferase involved in cell wall biosynthesis